MHTHKKFTTLTHTHMRLHTDHSAIQSFYYCLIILNMYHSYDE